MVVLNVMQWLGAMGGWEAALTTFGGLAGTAVGVAWPIVRAVRKQRQLDLEAADKPVAPRQQDSDAEDWDAAMRRTVADMAGWVLEEARAEVKRVQAEVVELRAKLTDTTMRLHEAQLDLERTRARVTELERQLDEAKKSKTSGVQARAGRLPPPGSKKDSA